MGLFGRDDRPSPQPEPTMPAAAQRTPVQPKPHGSAEMTLLSSASSFEGSVAGSGDVTVEGKLKGSVRITGRLLVAESGNANASLHGRVVLIAGKVKGNVTADEKIELRSSARLRGNITAPRILIQEGAIFEGQVVMKNPEDEASKDKKTPHEKPAPGAKGPIAGPDKSS